MNDRTRKIVLIILAIVGTVIGVRIVKSFAPEKVKGAQTQESYKAVRVHRLTPQQHSTKVEFSGKAVAFKKIDLFAEVNGVLRTEKFRAGNSFDKGEILISLNSSEFENQLKASKSQLISQMSSIMGDLKIDYPQDYSDWVKFLDEIDVAQALPNLPEISSQKLKRFVATKGIFNSYYSIKSQEEKLSKFSISAPFSGVLAEVNLTDGTLVRAGQKLGTFIKPNLYELETEVSLADLSFVKKGYQIELRSAELNRTWMGEVHRINQVIDPQTQMVKVYVAVKGNDLKHGMYLHGSAEGISYDNVVKINRKLVSDGMIFTVVDNTIMMKKVEVLHTNQSEAIVRGLTDQDQIVSDNMKGLYEGMKVTLINK